MGCEGRAGRFVEWCRSLLGVIAAETTIWFYQTSLNLQSYFIDSIGLNDDQTTAVRTRRSVASKSHL